MIELENVSVGYNNKIIVQNIHLNAKQGTITSIIGKNGCGKSTLLKTFAGILKPISGHVILDSKNIKNIGNMDFAKSVSFLPQNRNIPNNTVYNLVKHGRYPHLGFSKIPTKRDMDAVERAIEMMELQCLIEEPLIKLSGGERQKAYMAMVLAQETDYIFLDEPTTFLDIEHQFELMFILQKLKEAGKAIVMVLHDISQALLYSDNVCIIHNGNIVYNNSPYNLINTHILENVFHIQCAPLLNSEHQVTSYTIQPLRATARFFDIEKT